MVAVSVRTCCVSATARTKKGIANAAPTQTPLKPKAPSATRMPFPATGRARCLSPGKPGDGPDQRRPGERATGPKNGARRALPGPSRLDELDNELTALAHRIGVEVQAMEDALCNWQK